MHVCSCVVVRQSAIEGVHEGQHSMMSVTYFGHSISSIKQPGMHIPVQQMDILSLDVPHKHANALLLSQRLNGRSFERQSRVQSASEHCRSLHNDHSQSYIPLDFHDLKSFKTFREFSLTCSCRYSKFSRDCQLLRYLVHSMHFHFQIISLSFYTLFIYFSRTNCIKHSGQRLCTKK